MEVHALALCLKSHAARRAALTAAKIPFSRRHAFHKYTSQNIWSKYCKNQKTNFEKSNTFQQANRCQLCIRFGKKTLLIQTLNHGASKHAWFHLSSKCYYFLGVQIISNSPESNT